MGEQSVATGNRSKISTSSLEIIGNDHVIPVTNDLGDSFNTRPESVKFGSNIEVNSALLIAFDAVNKALISLQTAFDVFKGTFDVAVHGSLPVDRHGVASRVVDDSTDRGGFGADRSFSMVPPKPHLTAGVVV